MANPSYFGVRLGEAISSGAGHIAGALQKRYEMEREAEAQKQAQQQALQMEAAKMGIAPTAAPVTLDVIAERNRERLAQAQDESKLRLEQMRQGINGKAKPPQGFRYASTGNLEAIPGGPAAIKGAALEEKMDKAEAVQDFGTENMLATVDSAIKRVGRLTAGWGSMLANIPATEARTLSGKIDTIKANLGFDKLSQMRAASPTGGALGQVSDRELRLLTAAVQSLDQGMKPEDLKENLEIIKTSLSKWREIMRKAQPGERAKSRRMEFIESLDDSKISEMEAAIQRGE
jgi:hypothetical protein